MINARLFIIIFEVDTRGRMSDCTLFSSPVIYQISYYYTIYLLMSFSGILVLECFVEVLNFLIILYGFFLVQI